MSGGTGVCHTRRATDAAPAERNSHSHVSSDIAVVHILNGIIENHEALREELIAKGHRSQSETDTEVDKKMRVIAVAPNGPQP